MLGPAMERSHRGLEPETPRGLRNARGGWRSGRRCTSTGSWSAGRTLPRSPTPGPAGSWWSCTLWRRCGLSSRRAAKATVYWNLPERERRPSRFLPAFFAGRATRRPGAAARTRLISSCWTACTGSRWSSSSAPATRATASGARRREAPTEKRPQRNASHTCEI